jgi:signal peptidase I
VLVLKPLYHVRPPERGDVVVFKFPEKPQDNHIASNYIKRAMGFGGETLAFHRGDLFVTRSLVYPEGDPRFPRPADSNDLWRGNPDRGPDYRYRNSAHAEELFAASRDAGFPQGQGGFEIVRKTEDHLFADMRIVWDNDKQPRDLAGVLPPRWYDANPKAGRWNPDNKEQPRAFAHTGGELDWIRYRHLAMEWKRGEFETLKKQEAWYIDNFLGYNASRPTSTAEQLWVGDLILECEAEIPAGSEVILELSKGPNRFQAKFGNGQVSLARIGPKGPEFGNPSRPCKVNAGTYKLRFANVDCRLWVWVDGKRIDFGAEADYSPAMVKEYDKSDTHKEGWTQANDVDAPASIGAKGSVPNVRAIKLHRDIYYTWGHGRGGDYTMADIYYIHPGHYMCLGDNSAHSSDSREWGVVPERLMLGKAVFVFFPVRRVGFIK